jgi:putative SOS response-associated peptidase YedK
MCGRYTLSQSEESIAAAFGITAIPKLLPRYNIAPTQPVPTVLLRNESQRQLQLLHWGLIPSWAKDPSMGAKMINARAETIAEKPSFRSAFRRRRCLIVADGFYEWQRRDKRKQPYYFRVGAGELFAFAGLWEHWQNAAGDEIESCTIVTTDPNDLMQSIHDRMPVILHPQDYDRWLDPATDSSRLLELLRPFEANEMQHYPVSLEVNNPRHDSPNCIQPVAA